MFVLYYFYINVKIVGLCCQLFYGYLNFICFTDLLRTIKDPEKPNTLEELNVVYEEGIFVSFKSTEENLRL